MNLTVKLQFGDNDSASFNKEYLVVDYHTRVCRSHNAYHPSSAPVCEVVEVTVVAPDKSDLTLLEWYLENTCMSGRLLCVGLDVLEEAETARRCIVFRDAQCFGMRETYDATRPQRRYLTLSFSPGAIEFDGLEYLRHGERGALGGALGGVAHVDVDLAKFNEKYDY